MYKGIFGLNQRDIRGISYCSKKEDFSFESVDIKKYSFFILIALLSLEVWVTEFREILMISEITIPISLTNGNTKQLKIVRILWDRYERRKIVTSGAVYSYFIKTFTEILDYQYIYSRLDTQNQLDKCGQQLQLVNCDRLLYIWKRTCTYKVIEQTHCCLYHCYRKHRNHTVPVIYSACSSHF